MEPENKKEIRIGWWKFVGVQASVVVLLCLVFVAAQMYPQEIMSNHLERAEIWKKTKERYQLAASKMANIDQLLRKTIDSAQTLTPVERKQVEDQCKEFEQDFMKSGKKPPSVRIPNMYQLLAMQCLRDLDALDKLKASSSGNCAGDLLQAQLQVAKLTGDLTTCQTNYSQYVNTHCTKAPDHQ